MMTNKDKSFLGLLFSYFFVIIGCFFENFFDYSSAFLQSGCFFIISTNFCLF